MRDSARLRLFLGSVGTIEKRGCHCAGKVCAESSWLSARAVAGIRTGQHLGR